MRKPRHCEVGWLFEGCRGEGQDSRPGSLASRLVPLIVTIYSLPEHENRVAQLMRKFDLISALPQLVLHLHDTLMPFLERPHILPYKQVFRWPGSKSLQTVAFFPRSMLCITHQSGPGFYLFDWDEADVSSCQAEGFFISSSPQVEDITGRFFAGLFPTLWSLIGIQKNNQR